LKVSVTSTPANLSHPKRADSKIINVMILQFIDKSRFVWAKLSK
jgi:hypothetical protein